MLNLFIGFLAAALTAGPQAAVTNAVSPVKAATNNPVEQEYRKLLEMDDTSQGEVDHMIKEEQKFKEKGGGQEAALKARVLQTLDPVKKAYEDFLKRNPNHVDARVAYGSFLNDIGEEDQAQIQWEKAREIDPKDPAIWNNLANYYGHNGMIKKAFDYYGKAIELNPKEPIYYQNLGTSVYMFRRDAMEHFNITETQVFEKAMALYYKALDLDPENFVLATDVAQSYYGIKLPVTGNAEADKKAAEKQTEQALAAWHKALQLARDDTERQGIYIHLARVHINAGRFDEARKNLNSVTNALLGASKNTLLKKMARLEGTNAAPAKVEKTK
jgi:tetratricopeptide (TPR) repeat protein